MEHFDPDFVPNGSDSTGRYSYRQQPAMCRWNLQKFGEALGPLLAAEDAASAVSAFDGLYEGYHAALMREKFGLLRGGDSDEDGEELMESFFAAMEKTHCDFTDAFVALTECNEELLLLLHNSEETAATSSSAAALDGVFNRSIVQVVNDIVSCGDFIIKYIAVINSNVFISTAVLITFIISVCRIN